MKGVLFHQDNAHAHKSMVAMAAVCDCGFALVNHPPYSPDLVPSDYLLFPNMKKHLAGKQYRTDDEVISAVEEFFLGSGGKLHYHANPSTATPMEEVCGMQGRICWKINHIWSNSTNYIIVSL